MGGRLPPPAAAALALALALCLSLPSRAAAQVRLGSLSTEQHDVEGEVWALSMSVLEVRDFQYDGEGPDGAVFWVDNGRSPSSAGAIAPERPGCSAKPLAQGRGRTVVVELPGEGLAAVGYVSVWSRTLAVSFGGLAIDRALVEGLLDTPAGELWCVGDSGETEIEATGREVFAVEDGWNCEPLEKDELQVRWRVRDEDIDVELVGRIADDEYMSFGPSGSNTKTKMVGGDPAIAMRAAEGGFTAVDYYMSNFYACGVKGEGAGVCPDVDSAAGGGSAKDSLTDVSGDREGDIVRVRYVRPLAAADEVVDKAFSVSGETFIAWAMGPVKVLTGSATLPNYHGLRYPTGDVKFAIGRAPADATRCAPMVTRAADAVAAEPFERPVLPLVEGEDVFARIGPSGGDRGLAAIAGRLGWGIAWWLQQGDGEEPILAATLGVERGRTYRFRVSGGDDAGVPGDYHPFYITSSEEGGGGDAVRESETVYAEPVEGAICKLGEGEGSEAAAGEGYGEYVASLDTACAEDAAVAAGAGMLEWAVADDTPDLVWYQSRTQALLGWKIRVFEKDGMDEEELEKINVVNRVGREERENSSDCNVSFKGSERTFQACRTGLDDKVDVYWNIDGGQITTLFSGEVEEGGYVGWSWGQNTMLRSDGDGAAVIAFANPASGDAAIREYSMKERSSSGVQPRDDSQITDAEAEISGGRVLGLYTQPLSDRVVNGRTDAVWAVGPKVSSTTALANHNVRGAGTFDLAEGVAGAGDSVGVVLATKWKVHGWLMGVAWIVLAPLGALAMRFFKRWNPFAFRIHQLLMSGAFAAATGAFIMALINGSRTEIAHLSIGCVVMGLALLQVLFGAFRPGKDSARRGIWYRLHSNFGRLTAILAVVNVFIGLSIAGASVALKVVAGVLVGLMVVAFVVLSALASTFPTKEDALHAGPDKAEL